MGKNKLDLVNFAKIFEEFGEQAAKDTLADVNSGKVRESTIEKYLYRDESKEDFTKRLRDSFIEGAKKK